MALPETVRVKLSPEDAGYLSVAPVVWREMPLRELVELMLDVAGKSPERIGEFLLRGVFVSGATRFRWSGFPVEPAALTQLLAGFPDPEPARPFAGAQCVRVVLSGPRGRLEISRQVGARRRWFKRLSFWDALLALAADATPQYLDYCYKERSDCYRLALSAAALQSLRRAAGLLRYRGLAERIRREDFQQADFYVTRL